MASRQVMRSVSADFCASAGAAIASVMQAARSAPRRQLSDRIHLVLFNTHMHQEHTTPQALATSMPTHWLRAADGPDLSVTDGREQPFQETVDGLTIDPANNGHEIVLRIDIDQLGAVAAMGTSGGQSL